VITRGEELPAFDYQCPLLSLPLAFNTNLQSIPAQTRYLHVDAARVAHWRKRLEARTGATIGLRWSGNATYKRDHHRSIPLAELMQHLPAEFQYVSLQKDLRDADRETLRGSANICHFGDELGDFSDAAALCESLDLVISVDTSVAHLSAGLGRETWILLPATPDWRWLLDRRDSPWYPTATLYRQQRIGDWGAVLERLAADLLARFGAPVE
jgi:ADP-heptose:LPS heptosyltransferase